MADKGASLTALGWLGIAAVGVAGGLLLGHVATGGMNGDATSGSSYAELTGNPDALSVDSRPVDPCYDCADARGYGSALQSKFARAGRMSDEFRELGAVAIDYAADEPADDYRYGGRFEETDVTPVIAMQSPVAIPPVAPASDMGQAAVQEPPIAPVIPPPSAEVQPATSQPAE